MKVVLDANVLLDRSPGIGDSSALWDAAHRRQIEGYIVATAVTNLFYIARKTAGSALALEGMVAVDRCIDKPAVTGSIPGDPDRAAGFESRVRPGQVCEADLHVPQAVELGRCGASGSPAVDRGLGCDRQRLGCQIRAAIDVWSGCRARS